ncbi:IS110 family transposase [Mesorhizobium sp. M0954]|uniref:hypothetical protein n=1 Tax=Mesorhizobium sp. M0954 TaxID=2957032 RepID=UPI0033393CFD
MTIFVGLDWGGSSHAVWIADAGGKILEGFVITHDRDGLADPVARLRRHGRPEETPVAIERPSGLIVDVLIEAGFVARRSIPMSQRRAGRATAPSPLKAILAIPTFLPTSRAPMGTG